MEGFIFISLYLKCPCFFCCLLSPWLRVSLWINSNHYIHMFVKTFTFSGHFMFEKLYPEDVKSNAWYQKSYLIIKLRINRVISSSRDVLCHDCHTWKTVLAVVWTDQISSANWVFTIVLETCKWWKLNESSFKLFLCLLRCVRL